MRDVHSVEVPEPFLHCERKLHLSQVYVLGPHEAKCNMPAAHLHSTNSSSQPFDYVYKSCGGLTGGEGDDMGWTPTSATSPGTAVKPRLAGAPVDVQPLSSTPEFLADLFGLAEVAFCHAPAYLLCW